MLAPILSPLRGPLPLTMRILRYLEALREPCHYITLADVLRRPKDKVQIACWHLTKRGSLALVKPGYYAITARGIAASQGGSCG